MQLWWWCLLIAFEATTISHAIPVPEMSSAETELRQLELDKFAGVNNNRQAVRNGRQGGFYDYFAYPSEYPSDYHQPSYYPDYYGSYYDSMAYQPTRRPTRRPSTINSPIGYPSRRKFNQRRKNIEASTQRWTVWDLARK